jgi:2-alkyl-3-oxoalkanoate reductase
VIALVTGGGGFLGLYIVEQLLEAGYTVRVLCRNQYSRLERLGVGWIKGDIRNQNIVNQACEDADVVFHVAALPGIWGSWNLFHSINTQGTQNVLDACTKAGVKKLVYTSSPSVVFDGEDHIEANEKLRYPTEFQAHYPHSKALAEQAVLSANGQGGLATCAIRPHLIWGPRDTQLIPRLIQRAKSGKLRKVGDGTNVISMSYVENVAAAHIQAAKALEVESPVGGNAYFINEPDSVNCWDWINTLLQRAGLPPIEKTISASKANMAGGVFELIYKALFFLPGEPPMTRFLASQLSTSHSYKIDKAIADFDYQPRYSVEEGLAKLEPELKRLAAKQLTLAGKSRRP